AAADLAHQVLATTAADLGLPTAPAAQEAVAAALARFRQECSDLVAAVQRCGDREQDVETWQAELAAAEETLTAAAEEALTADDEHRAADAAWHTLQETLGGTVEELTAQLDRTVAALTRLGAEHKDVEQRHLEARDRLNLAAGKQEVLLTEQAHRQDRRDQAVAGLRSFAATGLLAVAAPELEIADPAEEWAADPAVRLARRVEATLGDIDDSDQSWKRVQDDITRRFTELTEALTRHSHQAHADLRDGLYVVSILYSGRERAPRELLGLISAEVELRERELTTREQQVLEEHLVGDVASRLQELITEADAMVGWMNAELAERPTSTGMRLRLAWQPDPDGPEGLAQARAHLLRQTSQLWSAADRRAVGDFLQRQIQRMRAEDPQGTWTEHLRRALDYRGWHRFVIERLQDGNWRSAVGPASGGERVLTVSLPLFAAASAHYRSAHPHAPRLVLLDEAFAGVDDDSRAKCLGLLTQFDLDVAMTSEREWGFYATVPGIATYQLVRHEGVDAVHVTAWEWDGVAPQQVPRSTTLPVQAADGSRSARNGRNDAGPDGPGADPDEERDAEALF
ncbi:MAG TPA: TIGR02680 family protein, partial [Kineosporiaceae bacterium]|nr:TIGR02680 family protein [Kineosporiaceae bacterium]